jgi:hypothetical protein
LKLHYITRGLKVAPRLLRSNIAACAVNQAEARIFPVAAEESLDGGKGLLNGIEIRRIRREKYEFAY